MVAFFAADVVVCVAGGAGGGAVGRWGCGEGEEGVGVDGEAGGLGGVAEGGGVVDGWVA